MQRRTFPAPEVRLALCIALCATAAMPLSAQDRVFTDDFETEVINNLIGLEEGFEGSRVVTAAVCDYEGIGIDEITLRYRAVGAVDPWSEVAMSPSVRVNHSGVSAGRGASVCAPYETSSTVPFEYGLMLEDNGQIEWEFRVAYSDGAVGSYPEGSIGRTVYWADEDTAQATIEGILGNDDNVLALCFDCNINLDSDSEGPYDANIFFIAVSTLYAIEYNAENYSSQRIDALSNFYHDPENERYFYLLPPSPRQELINGLQSLSAMNQ